MHTEPTNEELGIKRLPLSTLVPLYIVFTLGSWTGIFYAVIALDKALTNIGL